MECPPPVVHEYDDYPGSREARARRFAAGGRTKRDYLECVLLCILAVFLPPAAVACVTGCDGNFALNLILTLIGVWGTGLIHALFVIFYYGGYVSMNTTRRQRRRERRRQEELGVMPPPVLPRQPTPHGGKEVPNYYPRDVNAVEGHYPLEAYATGYEVDHKPNEEYARDDAWDMGPPKPSSGLRGESEGGLFYS